MAKHLLTRTVPGLLLAFALLFTAPSIASDWWLQGATSSSPNATVVNLATASNPCATLQAAVDPYNAGAAHVTVDVFGHGTYDFTDLVDQGSGAFAYRTCLKIAPDSGFKAGIANGSLTINWHDARLTFDDSGLAQSEAVVPIQLGGMYELYPNGYIARTLTMRGNLTLTSTTQNRGSAVAGYVPGMPFGTNTQSTSIIYVFAMGVIHADFTGMSWVIKGATNDYDDLGMYLSYGFGTWWGNVDIQTLGTGVETSSFMGGAEIGPMYIQQNSVNVVVGDRAEPDGLTWSGGFVASPAQGLTFRTGVIEGGTTHNVIVFTAANVTFEAIHMEKGTQFKHFTIVGAGLCTDDALRICGLDADCAAGTCVKASSSSIPVGDLTFSNGVMPFGETDANIKDFVMGPGALSDTNRIYQVVFQNQRLATQTDEPMIFSHANATLPIMIDIWKPSSINLGFSYPYVKVNGGMIEQYDFSAYNWTQSTNRSIRTYLKGSNVNQTMTFTDAPSRSMPETRFCNNGTGGSFQLAPDASTNGGADGGGTISFIFSGLTLSAGDHIINTPNVRGSCVTVQAVDATTLMVVEATGTWVDNQNP